MSQLGRPRRGMVALAPRGARMKNAMRWGIGTAYRSIILVAIIAIGCRSAGDVQSQHDPRIATAEAFIDAFYSFDQSRLSRAMASAQPSISKIVYYQGWARGGNYEVLHRSPCKRDRANEVSCAITVKDDLIPALGLSENVTDTFHLTFEGETLVGVRTSSNDPKLFDEALAWLKRERASTMEEPCKGFFAGGPTPEKCVQVVVRGFREFTALLESETIPRQ